MDTGQVELEQQLSLPRSDDSKAVDPASNLRPIAHAPLLLAPRKPSNLFCRGEERVRIREIPEAG